jgi:hypothetical protein
VGRGACGSIFLGFLRSEATRLLLKLRAGLIEAAGYWLLNMALASGDSVAAVALELSTAGA